MTDEKKAADMEEKKGGKAKEVKPKAAGVVEKSKIAWIADKPKAAETPEKPKTVETPLIDEAAIESGAVEVLEVDTPGPEVIEALVAEDKVKKVEGSAAIYDDEEEVWTPKTAIGKKVYDGEITDINEILRAGMPIMESGLVNKLLPGMSEEVIHVRRVQRTLDSGRRMKFSILAAVGDKNGHVGLGLSKGVEAGPTIKKAIARAKLNIIEVPRGCASWECGCGEPHTVPFKVTGKKGSVEITLKPAPKGVGLVVGENSKKVLEFAGIKDAWEFNKGHSRTVVNQAFAVYDALKRLSKVKTETSKKKSHKKE